MHLSRACVTQRTGSNTIRSPLYPQHLFLYLLHYTLPILELQMKPDNEAAAAAALFDLLAREPAEHWHLSNRPLNLPSNGAGEQQYYIR